MTRTEVVSALAQLATDRHAMVRSFKEMQTAFAATAVACPDVAQELVELQAFWAAIEVQELAKLEEVREQLLSYLFANVPTVPSVNEQLLGHIAAVRGAA